MNTPPFPDSRLMDENVFIPVRVRLPAEMDIRGVLFVAYSDAQLNVIVSKVRLASDVIESREISLESCAVSVIVNAFRV